VVALSGCEKAPPPAKLIRPVLTQQVEIQPYYQEASYAGEVRAHHETVLGFRVNGKIVERYVEVGDMVKPGDVLARLDDEDNTLRLTEAEAGLAAAKAERNKAAADLERRAALLDKKAVSTADYQDFLNAFEVAKARLEQAEARLEVTRNQAEYTALTSDLAGVITAVEGEVGQVVAAGQTVLRLALAEEKEVRIAVPENRSTRSSKRTRSPFACGPTRIPVTGGGFGRSPPTPIRSPGLIPQRSPCFIPRRRCSWA
jgi:RND family efflux transporter MFP subunit